MEYYQPTLPFHPEEAARIEARRQKYIEDICSDIQDQKLYRVVAEIVGQDFDDQCHRIALALGASGLA